MRRRRSASGTPTGATLLTNTEYDRLAPASAQRAGSRRPSKACLDGADKVESEEVFAVDGQDCTFLVVRYPVVDGTGRRFAVGGHLRGHLPAETGRGRVCASSDRLKGEFVATGQPRAQDPADQHLGYAELLLVG
jgi:hypothetical protein